MSTKSLQKAYEGSQGYVTLIDGGKLVLKRSCYVDFSIECEKDALTLLNKIFPRNPHFPQLSQPKRRRSESKRRRFTGDDSSSSSPPRRKLRKVDDSEEERSSSDSWTTVSSSSDEEESDCEEGLITRYVPRSISFDVLKEVCVESFVQTLAQIYLCVAGVHEITGIAHNDLHSDNIILSSTKATHHYYVFDDKTYIVRTHGIVPVIIDFGLAYVPGGHMRMVSDFTHIGYLPFHGHFSDDLRRLNVGVRHHLDDRTYDYGRRSRRVKQFHAALEPYLKPLKLKNGWFRDNTFPNLFKELKRILYPTYESKRAADRSIFRCHGTNPPFTFVIHLIMGLIEKFDATTTTRARSVVDLTESETIARDVLDYNDDYNNDSSRKNSSAMCVLYTELVYAWIARYGLVIDREVVIGVEESSSNSSSNSSSHSSSSITDEDRMIDGQLRRLKKIIVADNTLKLNSNDVRIRSLCDRFAYQLGTYLRTFAADCVRRKDELYGVENNDRYVVRNFVDTNMSTLLSDNNRPCEPNDVVDIFDFRRNVPIARDRYQRRYPYYRSYCDRIYKEFALRLI